jgi:hypothetical protein
MAKRKLKLLTNLGTIDAAKLGIDTDPEGLQAGKTVSVDEKFVDIMVKNAWAAPEGAKAAVAPGRVAKPLPDRMPDDPAALLPGEKPGKVTAKVEGEEGDESEEEEDSPVSDMNAPEAIEAIERSRSKDKLQHIIDNDQRSTVQDAARKRLESLG